MKAVYTGKIINPNWMILDSCYTISLVKNQDLLQSVKTCTPNDKPRVYTNGEYLDYYRMGTLKNPSLYVFYYTSEIRNILSLE